MGKAEFDKPHYQDEAKAREYIESHRWPDGPVCPHCGVVDHAYKLEGAKTPAGTYKCAGCRKKFTVCVGTIFERSHIPLTTWLKATYFLCASQKGMSSHQLHRTLGLTYKSARFMAHRIREAMKDSHYTNKLGGNHTVVEADETYWGNSGKQRRGARGYAHKEKIFSLVERGGKVRSFHVETVAAKTLRPIMREQIAADTKIYTDDMGSYKGSETDFVSHHVVRHGQGEYVRGEIHTNTIENFFSILKRGLVGTYQHVGANRLRRYVGEFDFRYNNRQIDDSERATTVLRGSGGKRLLYRDSSTLVGESS